MLSRTARARGRLAMAIGAALVVGWLVWSARYALYPFIVGIIAAFALAPIVDRVARLLPFRRTNPDLAVSLAVALVYAATLLILITLGVQLVPRVGNQLLQLADRAPALVAEARERFEQGTGWYRRRVPPNLQRQIDQSTQELAGRAGAVGLRVVGGVLGIVTGTVGNALSYIVVPFWIFFLLKDYDRGAAAFIRLFPPSWRDDVTILLQGAGRTMGSFIRAQLVLSVVSGVIAAAGLWLLGVPFSLILGVIAAIASLIPVLGAMLGGIPALIVTIATKPGWTVLWVFLFLFITQNLKAYVIVPRIQGQAVKLHAAVILVLLAIAGSVAGFWGLLLVVPLAAVARDVFVYIYRRLGDEPSEPALTAATAQAAPALTDARSPRRAAPAVIIDPEPAEPPAR